MFFITFGEKRWTGYTVKKNKNAKYRTLYSVIESRQEMKRKDKIQLLFSTYTSGAKTNKIHTGDLKQQEGMKWSRSLTREISSVLFGLWFMWSSTHFRQILLLINLSISLLLVKSKRTPNATSNMPASKPSKVTRAGCPSCQPRWRSQPGSPLCRPTLLAFSLSRPQARLLYS